MRESNGGVVLEEGAGAGAAGRKGRKGRGCWQMRVRKGGRKRAVKEGLTRNDGGGGGMTFKWEEGKGKKEKAEGREWREVIRSTNCNCAKE